MIVSDKYNFAFFHNPKCGGTSISNAIKDAKIDGIKKDYDWGHKGTTEFAKEYGEDRLKDITKIICVRDPMEVIKASHNTWKAIEDKNADVRYDNGVHAVVSHTEWRLGRFFDYHKNKGVEFQYIWNYKKQNELFNKFLNQLGLDSIEIPFINKRREEIAEIEIMQEDYDFIERSEYINYVQSITRKM